MSVRPLLLLLLAVPALAAADPATRLPRELLCYAELKSPASLPAQVLELAGWQDADAARAVWARVAPRWRDKLLRVPLDPKLLDRTWRATTRLVLCLRKLPEQDRPLELLALLDLPSTTELATALEQGFEQERWTKLLAGKQVVYRATLEGGQPLLVHLTPGRAALATNLPALLDHIARNQPHPRALAAVPAFAEARRRHARQPLWGFGDARRLLGLLAARLPREARRRFDLIDAELRLGGAEWLSFAAGSGSEVRLHFAGRSPTLDLLAPGPFDRALLRHVPARASSYVLGLGLDRGEERLGRLHRLAERLAKQTDDPALRRLLADGQRELGVTAGELLSALGPSWVVATPFVRGRFDRRSTVLVTAVADRPRAVALLDKIKLGPWARRNAPKLVRKTYRGALIERADSESGPGYALLDRTLLLTADHRGLEPCLDAPGRSIVERFGLAGQPTAQHWLLLDPLLYSQTAYGQEFLARLYGERRAWQLDLHREGDGLLLRSNLSLLAIGAAHLLTAEHNQQMQQIAMDCEANLERLGQALRKHYRAHQALPQTLDTLKLDPQRLACPHGKQAYAYRPAKLPAKQGLHWTGPMVGWCANPLHGKIVLDAGGYCYKASELEFQRRRAEFERRR